MREKGGIFASVEKPEYNTTVRFDVEVCSTSVAAASLQHLVFNTSDPFSHFQMFH